MRIQSVAFACQTCRVLKQTDHEPTLTAPPNDLFAARTSDCQADCRAPTRPYCGEVQDGLTAETMVRCARRHLILKCSSNGLPSGCMGAACRTVLGSTMAGTDAPGTPRFTETRSDARASVPAQVHWALVASRVALAHPLPRCRAGCSVLL
jgi:hypothetical protein